ncbi:FAD-dependent oxidoreductase [bacterium]|nr:FAD-dependent oxidoreductase [bacterium]
MRDKYIGFNKNADAAPARKVGDKVIQPEKEIPVLAETDVLILGGGPSGFVAAVAAARQGVKVTLAERYGHLGGLATGGLVLYLDGYWDGECSVVRGIGSEIADQLEEMGGITRPGPGRDGTADPELLKYLALKMVRDSGVDLILHCWAFEAIANDGNVQGAITLSKSGRQAILAKVVIDATGDGDIFASAGAAFHEAQRGIGLPFRMGGVDTEKARQFQKENSQKYKELMDEVRSRGGFTGIGAPAVHHGVIWWNNWGNVLDALDVTHLTRAEIEAREAIMTTVTFLKENLPGFENSFLLETAPQLGVRESRLLVGEYTLTHDDITRYATFDDVIAHFGILFERKGNGFDVPYRCLIPKEVNSLIATGRCISTDHPVQDHIRVIPKCFALGHAAGTAAGLAVKAGIQPRNIDISDLQKQLMRESAYLGDTHRGGS